jgi:hypothetical protein
MESLPFLELAAGDVLADAVELEAPAYGLSLKLPSDQKGAFHWHYNPLA